LRLNQSAFATLPGTIHQYDRRICKGVNQKRGNVSAVHFAILVVEIQPLNG
jgi:hypothetical protein